MDELEISGKRYISTRRAAKENKYHSDYIGQLIRAGKVEGQKVGRSWYVGADSLSTYLSNEAGVKNQSRVVAEEVKPISVVTTVAPQPIAEVKPVIAEAREVEESNEASHVSQVLESVEDKDAHQIPVKIAGPAETYMRKRSSLRYIPDDEPLYPPVRQTRMIMREPVREEVFEEIEEAEEERPTVLERPRKKANAGTYIMQSSVALASVAVIIGVIFVASAFVVSTTVIEKGQPASVEFSIQKL